MRPVSTSAADATIAPMAKPMNVSDGMRAVPFSTCSVLLPS
ncbi:MAG: hypothetical protein QM704_26015 [Anaeromyxobacteraceae bacterium]